MGTRVAVAGASGYAGGELLRLIAGHPELELVAAAAHSQAGAPVRSVHPHLAALGDLTFTAADVDTLAAADLVFLALPHGESAALAAALPRHHQGSGPRRRSSTRRCCRLAALLRQSSRRYLDLRPARAARPAGADRYRDSRGQHRLLRRRYHPRARPAHRAWPRRPRRRGGGRCLRYLGCRTVGQATPARQ